MRQRGYSDFRRAYTAPPSIFMLPNARTSATTVVGDTVKPTMTPRETQEAMGICANTFYRLVQKGEIPHLKLGRKIVVLRGPLERMLNGEAPN